MKLTWLGHAAFHLNIGGTDLLIDPFWTGCPTFPAGYEDKVKKVDYILVSHSHADHIGDTARLAGKFGATVVAQYEICEYLGLGRATGLDKFEPMNTGGAITIAGITVTMVQAFHSSTLVENGVVTCVGDPIGFVISGGGQTLYFAGDTGVFGDMALIQRLYKPTIGLLPIGDRFTMGPMQAAFACNELLDLTTIIPIHWGTFGLLSGTPEAFKPLVKRGTVLTPTAGETIEV